MLYIAADLEAPSSTHSITARADKVRREVSPRLDGNRRAELGQFLTPEPVAADMAAMFGELPADVRLLDAGAGVGSLTAAFVTEALARPVMPRSITVTAFEVDPGLAELLAQTLDDCRAACEGAGVRFASRVIEDDYILTSAEPLLSVTEGFNCAILNPPYAKISSASRWRLALRSQGIETVNLYSAFVALALNQLEPGGELVAITPRSFCNGPYYRPFRQHLLGNSSLERLYVFESRKKAFRDDAVLQENVIFQLRKGARQAEHVRLDAASARLPQPMWRSGRNQSIAARSQSIRQRPRAAQVEFRAHASVQAPDGVYPCLLRAIWREPHRHRAMSGGWNWRQSSSATW